MKWGVVEKPDAVHVVPCDREGFVLEGHVTEPTCECRPTPMKEPDWTLTKWSHHDGQ